MQDPQSRGIQPSEVWSTARPVTRVILIDDHAMIRQGLRSLLEGHVGVEVVGEGKDGLEALELACRLNPDVVVMDLRLPRLDGLEATKLIHQERPAIAIIGLSVDRSKSQALKEAGAVACLSKEPAADELFDVIQRIMAARRARTEDNGKSR
jgi:DNA-binding NarL/FixJ family response regulator